MIPIRRLNHAVFYVRDVARSVAFYEQAFGFRVIDSRPRGRAPSCAPRSARTTTTSACSRSGWTPQRPEGAAGLYHLAWEVDSITDLVAARDLLTEMGALVGASDHEASKSLYGTDPDGNEFEVMWAVPRSVWEQMDHGTTQHLDLDAELARWSAPRLTARAGLDPQAA